MLLPLLQAGPVINTGGIVNASGYQAKLAPGAVFAIFGKGLGPDSPAVAQAPDYPPNLGGTTITFTPKGGGVDVSARLGYSRADQAVGVLPSSTTPGEYSAVVSYSGQSSPPQPVIVAARSFGIATANSGGTGPAQVTIGNVNNGISLVRLTTGSTSFNGYSWSLTPAHPDDTLVIWGTGGGADPANDTGGTSGDQSAGGQFKVLVGGTEVAPVYAGTSSGFPGLWQINFQVPSNASPDCFTRLQVIAGGEASNAATIAIAAPGQPSCSSDTYSADTMSKIDAGGTLIGGSFAIFKTTATNSFVLDDGTRTSPITTTTESGGGSIGRYSAAAIADMNSGIHIDKCTVFQKTAYSPFLGIGVPDRYLDAGATLALAGPGLSSSTGLRRTPNTVYSATLPSGSVQSGSYTISGGGGSDIGAFSRTIDLPGDFAVTNFDSIATINRAQPLTVTWTGGGSGDVQVGGTFQTTISGSGANPARWLLQSTSFYCRLPASAGTYTVPASVFSLLPDSSFDLTSGNQAFLSVRAILDTRHGSGRFPLASGGQTDWGTVSYSIGVTKNIPVLP